MNYGVEFLAKSLFRKKKKKTNERTAQYFNYQTIYRGNVWHVCTLYNGLIG